MDSIPLSDIHRLSARESRSISGYRARVIPTLGMKKPDDVFRIRLSFSLLLPFARPFPSFGAPASLIHKTCICVIILLASRRARRTF